MSTIKMLPYKFREFDTFEIYPLGDTHIGTYEFNERIFKKLVNTILQEKNRYVVIGGDIIDNAVMGSVASPYHAKMQPAAAKRYATDLLMPLKDRILCFVMGNHEARSKKMVDVCPLYDIASKMDLEDKYDEEVVFLKLDLGDRLNGHKRSPHYSVCVTHGCGGGVKLGAALSKSETFAISMGVDMMIAFHTHKPSDAPTERFECDFQKGVMVSRQVRILIGTAFMDYGGYPITKLFPPVAIRPNKAILNCIEHDIAVLS